MIKTIKLMLFAIKDNQKIYKNVAIDMEVPDPSLEFEIQYDFKYILEKILIALEMDILVSNISKNKKELDLDWLAWILKGNRLWLKPFFKYSSQLGVNYLRQYLDEKVIFDLESSILARKYGDSRNISFNFDVSVLELHFFSDKTRPLLVTARQSWDKQFEMIREKINLTLENGSFIKKLSPPAPEIKRLSNESFKKIKTEKVKARKNARVKFKKSAQLEHEDISIQRENLTDGSPSFFCEPIAPIKNQLSFQKLHGKLKLTEVNSKNKKEIPLCLNFSGGQKKFLLILENGEATACEQSAKDFLRSIFETIELNLFFEENFSNFFSKTRDWFVFLLKNKIIQINIKKDEFGFGQLSALLMFKTGNIIFKDNGLFLTKNDSRFVDKKFNSLNGGLEVFLNEEAEILESEKESINHAWEKFVEDRDVFNVSLVFNGFLLDCNVLRDNEDKKRKLDESFEEKTDNKVLKRRVSSEVSESSLQNIQPLEASSLTDFFYGDAQGTFSPLFFETIQFSKEEEEILFSSNTSLQARANKNFKN